MQRSFCAQSLTSMVAEEEEIEAFDEEETVAEVEEDDEIMDDDEGEFDENWEPEQRYQDFLKHYCTNNNLDDKKLNDIARKLDTGLRSLEWWVAKMRYGDKSNSDVPDMRIQFAKLTDSDGDIQTKPQVLFTRANGSIDLYWSSDRNIPALHSLILINNQYIGCIMKHLSTTHLRALIIGQINEDLTRFTTDKQLAKYLNNFPMIDWEPIHNKNDAFFGLMEHEHDPYNLLNEQNIKALSWRLKVPLIDNCVITSAGNQTIEAEIDDDFDCSIIDMIDNEKYKECKSIQSNNNSKSSHYPAYKAKLLRSMQMEFGEDSKEIVLHKICPSGMHDIDLLNPLTKHGINIIVRPKVKIKSAERDELWRNLMSNWMRGKSNHVIYADIFDDNMDAVKLQKELKSMIEDDEDNGDKGKLTIVAGNDNDCDWYKVQTVITASTIAGHGANEENDVFVLIPNGNMINECINNLQRNVCGSLSKLKFEHNDDIGHTPYDWILKKKLRGKPKPATEFYLNWGVEPVKDGPTYIIGLEMDAEQIQDVRIQPSAYFPWADTVAIFNENNELDVSHSSSKVLSEIEYTDFNDKQQKVLNGMRRLYSDCQVLKNINSGHGSIELYDRIFNEHYAKYDGYFGRNEYDKCLKEIHGEMKGKDDNNGKKLLNVKCLDTEDIEEQDILKEIIAEKDVPLVAMLQNAADDAELLETLNKLHEENKEMNLLPNEPELLIKAKFDHVGFVKQTRVNLRVELYNDQDMKHQMNIGPHAMLFINHKAIRMPTKYGFEKREKESKEKESKPYKARTRQAKPVNEENMSNQLKYYYKHRQEVLDYKNKWYRNQEQEVLTAFEKLSKCDAWHEFGLNVLRYEQGKVGNRCDFFQITGDLIQDVHDLTFFIFGYDGDIPFIIQKRVGPDALPVAGGRKRKRAKVEKEMKENEVSDGYIVKSFERKEFVLKPTNVTYNDDNTHNNNDIEQDVDCEREELLQLNNC